MIARLFRVSGYEIWQPEGMIARSKTARGCAAFRLALELLGRCVPGQKKHADSQAATSPSACGANRALPRPGWDLSQRPRTAPFSQEISNCAGSGVSGFRRRTVLLSGGGGNGFARLEAMRGKQRLICGVPHCLRGILRGDLLKHAARFRVGAHPFCQGLDRRRTDT